MQRYEKLEKIGEGDFHRVNVLFGNQFMTLFSGTYGTVFKAKNKETQEIVALKRVRLDDDDEVCVLYSEVSLSLCGSKRNYYLREYRRLHCEKFVC